jgi:molybdenum ABC transporter molybdate-binding protein
MTEPSASWIAKWKVGLRLWVERAGRAILGPGRLQLLEWIDRCHSISGAAKQMGMSYRRAWLLVESMNRAAGVALVEARTGGERGGGTRLTPEGRAAVAVFRDLQSQVRQKAAGLLPQLLPETLSHTVHVSAAVSLEEVLGQLATDFTLQNPAVPVRVVYGASDELAAQILTGATAHLFISADRGPLESLQAAGVRLSRPQKIAANTLAVIAAADWPGAVQKLEDLSQVPRLALAGPDSPLGRYTRRLLEQKHLDAGLEGRLVHVDNSRAVASAIRAGLAPVGIIYGSDVLQSAGCRQLFPIRVARAPVQYLACLVGEAHAGARDFLSFLKSPAGRKRFQQGGFAIGR